MIEFEIGYNNRIKTWGMWASCGYSGCSMWWLECKPTQKQVRKFKQKAHKSIKPFLHGGEA